jgi:hypothetical protein
MVKSAPVYSRVRAALAVVVVVVLMILNTAAWTAATDYSELGAHRRLWSDLADAVNAWLEHRFPAGESVATGDPGAAYRSVLLERIGRDRLRPWQFWRTIGPRAFLPVRASRALGLYDDSGRAILLAKGFRLLRGVSPFLILWLGIFVCLPLVAWMLWEFFAAGRGLAGTVFALLLGCSPYFLETLALTRYAVGFYLVALVPLVALSVYAVLGRPSPRGVLLRSAAAGVALAVCILCRSSSLLLMPGFALAVAVALRRQRQAPGRRAAAALLASALLLGPFLLVKQPGHHNVWSGFWEGFGDFDREKGHAWSDAAAEEASQRGGGGPLWTPGSEAMFRRVVLQAVREDPLWYGEILLKRLAATALQWKLWPWRPRDGTPMRASTSWNEGFMDKYYGYSTTVDHAGLGPWRVELPISALLLPSAVLIGLRRGGPLLVMAAVALATLALPVSMSTAAGQETQAFALTYLLGLAFLVDELWRRRRPAP